MLATERKRANASAPVPRAERVAAVLFFALPATVPILGIAAIVLTAGESAERTAGWAAQVLYLPVAALAGVIGAWILRPALVLGSAISVGVGALFAVANPPVALMYAACAGMLWLTARRMRERAREAA